MFAWKQPKGSYGRQVRVLKTQRERERERERGERERERERERVQSGSLIYFGKQNLSKLVTVLLTMLATMPIMATQRQRLMSSP